RLDTPKEWGGVTPDLVREIRARLDQGGYDHVDIYVSGGITPDRIRGFIAARAPVNVLRSATTSPRRVRFRLLQISRKSMAGTWRNAVAYPGWR
ncbi:MAG: hypothetical protein IIA53_11600, partial [Chloroflexi bacterium]|nr:hypothetical protein [Chloroflexota bacterium]